MSVSPPAIASYHSNTGAFLGIQPGKNMGFEPVARRKALRGVRVLHVQMLWLIGLSPANKKERTCG